MKKFFWLIFSLFFISRFFFLANYPHFYDSPEYLRESLSVSFFKSLFSSHEVVHPAWLFLTQIFQKITPQPTSWEISLISALFGLMSFLAFYFLIKRNFNKTIAIFSLIPLIFFPHLWLIQTNVLHESLDIGFFLMSLLFFDFFLERKKLSWCLLSIFCLSLAILDFVGILLWSPVFVGLAILRSKKINWSNIGWSLGVILISFILALSGLYGLLLLSHVSDPIIRLKTFFFGYGVEGIFSKWGFLDILRMLRNDGFVLFYGYSASAILGLIITGVYISKQKNFKLIIFLLSFLIPFMITGKFWYGGLFGRYAILVAYPLALLLGLMPWRKINGVLIAILFLSFLPTFLSYQKTPITQIQAGLIDKIGLRENDLLVLSDYQRPQLVYNNAVYLGGDKEQQKIIEEKINKRLLEAGRVFISQQAIDFPYWQYDGQQIHIISKDNKEKAQLKNFLKDKKLTIATEEKKYPRLTIYQLSL